MRVFFSPKTALLGFGFYKREDTIVPHKSEQFQNRKNDLKCNVAFFAENIAAELAARRLHKVYYSDDRVKHRS